MITRTTSDYFTIEQLEVGLKFVREYFDSWHKQDSSIAKADHDPDVKRLENLLDWRKTVLRLREVNWTDLAAHLEVRAEVEFMNLDHYQRLRILNNRLHKSKIADNLEVRKTLLERVRKCEITLLECQAELRAIQNAARKNNKQTVYGK